MNYIERLTADLEKNGLFTDQAVAIVTAFTSDPTHSMRGRWVEDTATYPEGMYNVLWATCKMEALRYIDSHCPKAWFRAVFVFQHCQSIKQNTF